MTSKPQSITPQNHEADKSSPGFPWVPGQGQAPCVPEIVTACGTVSSFQPSQAWLKPLLLTHYLHLPPPPTFWMDTSSSILPHPSRGFRASILSLLCDLHSCSSAVSHPRVVLKDPLPQFVNTHAAGETVGLL